MILGGVAWRQLDDLKEPHAVMPGCMASMALRADETVGGSMAWGGGCRTSDSDLGNQCTVTETLPVTETLSPKFRDSSTCHRNSLSP